VIEKLRDLLGDPRKNRRFNLIASWAIIALAGILRFFNLGYPQKLVFDETYYVKDAHTLWQTGSEQSWPDNPNPAFEAGHVDTFLHNASFVVHPPLGKWIIAIGMWLFGPANAFGWRFSTALLGVATVALLIVVARKLFKSHTWANLAGLFLAIEGEAIVMSRTGLLDAILTFFVLLGFLFLIRDLETRDIAKMTFNRPWLLAMAISLGAATAVKWSGMYFVAVFGIYIVMTEVLQRRASGQERWLLNGLLGQGIRSFIIVVPTSIAVYLLSWTGWFVTAGGYDRMWATVDSNRWKGLFSWVPDSVQSLIHYHQEILNFHINLKTPHSYQANPLTWLFNVRPTSFFYESLKNGEGGCQELSGCTSAITAIAHPLIWLAATASIMILIYFLIKERDRLSGLVLVGMAAGYLPWLAILGRTVFQFYAISFTPWMILALTYVIRRYLATASPGRSDQYLWGIISFILLSVAITVFFLPIWIGTWTSYNFWHLHMWLPSWI
jgi:dolichyl-phosphate-mannose-protein mannosyltransferase